MFDPEPRFLAEVFAKSDLGLALYRKKPISLCVSSRGKRRRQMYVSGKRMFASYDRPVEEYCATYFPTCLLL